MVRIQDNTVRDGMRQRNTIRISGQSFRHLS